MFQKGQTGVYIHWPFCLSKCPYCDFNIYLRRDHDPKDWLEGYLRAIRTHQQWLPEREIVSIYFGGGTPSLMAPEEVSAIIQEIGKGWRVANDVEITLEANPVSTEYDKFQAFRAAGINRLSLGVQSLRDDALKFLGRLHKSDDVRRAIEIADDVFERFTFDLIYARPGQSVADWENEILEAIPLMKGHLSAYQLTIKEGTAFERQVARGDFAPISDDECAEFYQSTNAIMAKHGMPAYEVSNYAAKGHESRHNSVYWHAQDYIGIGAGAHGRITRDGIKFATEDYKRPSDWMEAIAKNGHGAKEHEALSPLDHFTEILMGALRIRAATNLEDAAAKSGIKAWQNFIDEKRLAALCAEGWLKQNGAEITPTEEGWLRLDSLLPYILKETPPT